MIKTGDKVICIVSVMHKSGDYLCLEKGEVYTIKAYPGVGYSFLRDGARLPYFFPIERTQRPDDVIFSEIRHCYLTLAEWREKQIKSIIDE
jgi:hypothetical protein